MEECGFVAMWFPANVEMRKCGNVALTRVFDRGSTRQRKPYPGVRYTTFRSRNLGKLHPQETRISYPLNNQPKSM